MTWPEVLRWVTLIVSPLAALVGAAWTLGRIFRPWVANVARTEANSLYDRLRENDFMHVERRLAGIDSRLDRMDRRATEDRADFDSRLDRMEERIGARFDGVDSRLDRMEGRILAALAGRGDEKAIETPPLSPRNGGEDE